MSAPVDSRKSSQASGRLTLSVVPRVQRQHRLIEELRAAGGRVVGDRLAETLGVSVRTIERDVAELVAAGLPIEVRRGPAGGYRFGCPVRLAPVTFTPAEAGALVAALVAIGPYSSAAGQEALGKLLHVLVPSS